MHITITDQIFYELAEAPTEATDSQISLRVCKNWTLSLRLEDLRPLAAALLAKAEELERIRVTY